MSFWVSRLVELPPRPFGPLDKLHDGEERLLPRVTDPPLFVDVVEDEPSDDGPILRNNGPPGSSYRVFGR